MRHAQIFANIGKADAPAVALRSAAMLSAAGFHISLEESLSNAVGAARYPPISHECLGKAELALAFGGDGTVLRVVGKCAQHGTPVLGVHMGTFGFITCCKPDTLDEILAKVVDHTYRVEDRLMVEATLVRASKPFATVVGLNEVVLQRGVTAKMLMIDISIDDIPLTTYPADGILVATPTGSTAYNLSAGGPVTSPNIEALLLTPITAHTLGARPLVLAPGTVLRFRVDAQGEALLVADGDSMVELESGDEVIVRRGPYPAKLVLPPQPDFYDRLRKRLLWGARTSQEN